MKRNKRSLFLAVLVIFIVALLSGTAISAESVTIVGTINADGQIVTDNDQVFEIDDNEKGDELIKLVGDKVKVTGTVEEENGTKVITATSYEVIEE